MLRDFRQKIYPQNTRSKIFQIQPIIANKKIHLQEAKLLLVDFSNFQD